MPDERTYEDRHRALHRELEGLSPETIRAIFAGETRTRVKPLAGLEWRESGSGDGSRILTGYAAVFNQVTTLYEGKDWRMTEQIAPGFFDDVIAAGPDCHLNIGHDPNTSMARTGLRGVGGLELASDTIGLRVYARLSPADPDVQKLAAKMDLGIMDQMSFAFSVAEESLTVTTDEDGVETYHYDLLKCRRLYDVCVCALGAYPQTEAALRSYLALESLESRRRSVEVGAEYPERREAGFGHADGAETVAQQLSQHTRHVLLARARTAQLKYPRRPA